jgi:WD40 repeat protein
VANGQLKATFKSPTEHIMSLAFSPDGKTLAVGRYMEGLLLWDVTLGKAKVDFEAVSSEVGNSQFARSVTFSPDGKILAAGSTADEEAPEVKMWSISGE